MAIAIRLLEPALSEQMLLSLSRANPGYRFERSSEGKLIVAPTGLFASGGEGELFAQIWQYVKATGRGKAYPATGGFTLPDTSIVAPDATYVSNERLAALTSQDRAFAYVRLVPSVVFELASPSDILADLEAKMQRYLANGVGVAVLVELGIPRVTIWRPDAAPHDDSSARVAIGPEMPGFELDLPAIQAAAAPQ